MNKFGAHELGYANTAIITALLEHLLETKVLSREAATDILDKAAVSIKGFGNLAFVRGAVEAVDEIGTDLTKKKLL